jgi:hypothetical protein
MAKSEAIDLYSPFPPEEIARKLKAIMDDPMPFEKARVFGSGSQYDMTLRYVRRNVQNAVAPQLDASMEPHGGGTRITGELGQTTAGRFLPFFWFGFLSLFVIVGVSVAWFVPDALLFGVIFAGIPMLMMVLGAFAFRAGGKGETDKAEILAFLRRELGATPVV